MTPVVVPGYAAMLKPQEAEGEKPSSSICSTQSSGNPALFSLGP